MSDVDRKDIEVDMVQILMSTYNGEKYIREQIDSILNQTYDNIKLLIRDDGSTDKTLQILEEYSNKYDNISYYSGSNIGVKDSFYDLFKRVDDKALYIATSDQDDVWFPDKVEVAVKHLQDIKQPALYCCRPQLVDQNMVCLQDSVNENPPMITFGNALIENICIGCTMMINRKLYDFIDGRWPKESLIHDWWIYQVGVCFGTVYYDTEPHIYYRQHSQNVIGLDTNCIQLIQRRIRLLNEFKGKYTLQTKEFMDIFNLNGDNLYLAQLMVGTRNSNKCRWKNLFNKKIIRQSSIDTFLFKILMFIGWI